jgi:hypothetical protein
MSIAGSTEYSADIATGAGMLGLWDPASFREIVDYETWESALLEDQQIAGHISAGALVPVNIGGDGAFHVTARIGSTTAPAHLNEREARYQLVTSSPYRFLSAGTAVISGIEHIGAGADAGLTVELPAGHWLVAVALIDWQAEPGSRDGDGRPSTRALPDFILLINPADGAHVQFRTAVQTFDR